MAEKHYRATFSKNFLEKMIRIKDPDELIANAKKGSLQKTLGVWDLIILGIGAIIGSGIFAVVGVAAARQDGTGAGPALMLSMIIAAVACVFSALCYSEFASMIPVAGGAYIYTFSTMGEFAAWMVGWVLMLEYAIGYIAVACSWSNYLMQFLKGFEAILPSWLINPPAWLVNNPSEINTLISKGVVSSDSIHHFLGMPLSVNLPAILIILLISWLLTRGTKDSAKMATVMVVIKLAVIALFVFTGIFFVSPENWTPFAPNKFNGIFMGAFTIFFAYIGFDAIATTAEECKNPQKDLPIGIIGSLIITTIIYVSVALVLTGLQDTSGVVPKAFLDAPMAYVIGNIAQLKWASGWVSGLICLGSLAGLTSVLLVLQLAATRILFAMSRDNFLPKVFQQLHPKTQAPVLLTWVVGILSIFGTLILDLSNAADLCNFGTFTSFIIVCVAVLILRKTQPDRPRPFKVPFSPWFPALGIICCLGLMVCKVTQVSIASLMFVFWLAIGALIYLHFGYKMNRIFEIFDNFKNRKKVKKIDNR